MDFVKVRKHFLPVTPGFNFTRQHYKLVEKSDELGEVPLFDDDVPFDPASGLEGTTLPEVWLLVGATTDETLSYADQAGNETATTELLDTTVDRFAGPSPLGFGAGEQIDQVSGVTERPTS